jgi:CMP-N-acetylneuraminic acid synthetase
MKTIASICARGGSTGLPSKNIKILCGKPLIVHTIEQALSHKSIDRVYVSTDSKEIADIALAAGAEVPFIRPKELATKTAPKLPVIQHLIEFLENQDLKIDRIVDLDPTSPLRSLSDIDACIDLLDEQTDVVITGYPSDKNPYFNMVEKKEDGTVSLVKSMASGVFARQLAPKVFSMNASIYVWHRHTFKEKIWGRRVRLHVMPRERSIDIDSLIDFRLVELLMMEKNEGIDD